MAEIHEVSWRRVMLDNEQIKFRFNQFLNSYSDDAFNEKYYNALNRIISKTDGSLYVDVGDLKKYNDELYKIIMNNPRIMLSLLNRMIDVNDLYVGAKKIVYEGKIRFCGLKPDVPLNGINSNHIGGLISVKGEVIGVSPSRPLLCEAVFNCLSCHEKIHLKQRSKFLSKPKYCPFCRSNNFELLPYLSTFIDSQKVTMQQYPTVSNSIKLDIFLIDDLVNLIKLHDRIRIIGIVDVNIQRIKNKILRTFDLCIDANNVEILEF